MVNDILNTAVSGLTQASRAMNVRANNVVNSQTKNYQAQDPNRLKSAETSRPITGGERGNTVNLAHEIVGMMGAEHSLKENATVVRTADVLYKQTLKLKS